MLSKITFVGINLFSSGLLFGRSLLFLKYLPEKDLGAIILYQSIIAIFGLAQIGLFNGGLRIFSIDSDAHLHKDTNDTNITYVIVVTLISILIALVFRFFLIFDLTIAVLALASGGLMLLYNWFTNLLIARKKLKEINVLNLVSSLSSGLMAFSVFYLGLTGAVLSIGCMYAVFVVVFLFWLKPYRLNKLRVNKFVFKRMLSYGFIPFLGGIALLLNNQIDRFLIAEWISIDALGKFYLAITFLTIFDLIPNNLNSIFAPSAINNYAQRNLKPAIKTTQKFFLSLLAYSALATVLLFLFGERVISIVFPDKLDQLQYLFIMLPGIIALTLSKAFSFILYIALNLKGILWANILSVISYLLMLFGLYAMSNFDLNSVAYIKSAQGGVVLFFLIIITAMSWKKITKFSYLDENENRVG